MTRGPIRSSTLVLKDGRVIAVEIDPPNDLVKVTIDGDPPSAVMSRDLACTLGQALTRASGICGQERARIAEQAMARADRKARKAAP